MRIDISRYYSIVALTGAGISAGSGLRTYRGPGGVWEERNVEEYGNIRTLVEHPERTWELFGSMRTPLREAEPNAAHVTLARMEASLSPDRQFLLITQNIDGLHQRAGSRNVAELHGNVGRTRCSSPACKLEPYVDEDPHAMEVPRCPRYKSVLRPDIVLFGEPVAPMAAWQAKRALRDCDLFLAIGTSGTVSPASNFVRSAEYAGARTVYINLEPMMPPNPAFREEYLGRAETVVPKLLGTDDAVDP